MTTPTVPNSYNDHYYPNTHSPHTAPDPQVNAERDLYSHQQHHYVLPPHSPHTTSTTSSTNSPALSQYHNSAYSIPSKHAPHTAPAQFTSINPSPQVGDIQLDFIPLPTAQASAPPQPYTVPDADESAKYETSTSTPLTSTSYQHSSAPPFPEYSNGHYTSYEEQQQQPYVLPPPTSPYPVSPSHPNQTSQPSYDNVTFVETKPIDLSDGKYKMSPAAGGSIFLQNLRNPRKREFWILLVITLAIIFGVLGATVWKPDSNKKDSDKSNGGGSQGTTTLSTKTTGPALSNPVLTPINPTVLNPTAVVVPTPVSVSTGPVPPPTVTEPATPDRPTTTRDPPPPTTSSKPPPTGSKDEYFRCASACTSAWSSCLSNCKSSDTAYKSCVAPCNGDFICEVDCQNSNGCLKGCDGTLGRCNNACPSFTP